MSAKEVKPVAPLPFQWNLLAGAIAGVSEILMMYPLDVVKVTTTIGCFSYKCFVAIISDSIPASDRHRKGAKPVYDGMLSELLSCGLAWRHCS